MRHVAALYDIHGNLPAFEAALRALDAEGIDEIVIGGDVVLGPMPRETLDLVRALGSRMRCLRGNCDRLVVDAFDGRPNVHLPSAVRETVEWTARQLGRADRDFLAGLPTTLSTTVDGLGDVLLCHATPRSDEEIFTAMTPVDRVRPMLGDVAPAMVVCGHTHMQFDRYVDGTRIVNAGSVGMPCGPPGACWLRLGPDVRAMRTPYDLERAAALVRQSSYPRAEEFASGSVLAPPAEREMLEMLERASAGREVRDQDASSV